MVTKKKIGDVSDAFCGRHRYFFMCPGCGYAHCFTVEPGQYNGDAEHPTISVPVVIPGHLALFHCHSVIRDGQIIFKNDCSHEHAGYTYDLPYIK
jgi:hypothetical protein